MDFLRKLINDIIYDPQIAQTFLNLTQNNATIDIWLLKSNDLSNLGIIIDKKIDLYIETIVNTMKSENLLGDNVDTEYLKNLIKFNLSQIDYE